jgi:hypothetical protein
MSRSHDLSKALPTGRSVYYIPIQKWDPLFSEQCRACGLMVRHDSIADQSIPVIPHPIDPLHYQVLGEHVQVREPLTKADTLRFPHFDSAKCHLPHLH